MNFQRLIADARRGDAAARDELLRRYRAYLRYRAEFQIDPDVRPRTDASDVAQQVMLEAAGALANFRGESEPEFTAWIQTILARNLHNLHRDQRAQKRNPRRETPLDMEDDGAALYWVEPADDYGTPSQEAILGERAIALAQAIEGLPGEFQTAIRLRHLQGLKLKDVAAQMGRSIGTVAGLLRTGKSLLREELEGKV